MRQFEALLLNIEIYCSKYVSVGIAGITINYTDLYIKTKPD